MRILVTGARGQVGLELIAALARRGYQVHASDIAQRPADESLPDNVPWHHLDVTDAAQVRSLISDLRPDKVFHLAAILSARGEQVPGATYHVNQTGTYNLLEACRVAGVGQLMFTSTIAVFGPGLPNLVPDDAPLHPTTMYGVTKVAGELLGDYYANRFDLDFRCIRFPGLISASLPGGGTSDYALFMYLDGVRCGRYEAFCRPDTTIPLMYMPDGVRSLVELSEAPRDRLSRRVYNVAAFSPTAQEIAHSVERELPGARITFRPDPRRQTILDSWPNALDDTIARADWSWRPAYDLQSMTAELIPQIRQMLAVNPTAFGAAPSGA